MKHVLALLGIVTVLFAVPVGDALAGFTWAGGDAVAHVGR